MQPIFFTKELLKLKKTSIILQIFQSYFTNYFELKAVHLHTLLNITMVGGFRVDPKKQVLLFS